MSQPIYQNENQPPSEDASERTLVSIPLLLWRRQRLIIAVTVAALVLSIAYSLLAGKRYRSTARLYAQQSGPRLVGEQRPELQLADGEQFAATQAQLIRSAPVLNNAALLLHDIPSLHGINPIRKHLDKRVSTDVEKKSQIISVSYDGANPDDAATVVNRIVDSYIQYQRNQRREIARQLKATLETDLAERARELSDRTAELQQLQQKYGVISLSDDYETVVTDQLAKLSAALSEARLDAVNRQATYDEAVRSLNVSPEELAKFEKTHGIETFAATVTGEDKKDRLQLISVLQLRLREAESAVGPRHPQVVAYRAQLQQAVMSYVAALKQSMLTAVAKLKNLEQRLEAQQQLANTLTTTAVQFGRLRGEIRRLERLRDATNDRINEIQVAGNTVDLVTVVDRAVPDPEVVWPRPLRILPMGGAFGLLLGVGLAFLLEWHNPRVRTPEQVEALARTRILGAIPRFQSGDALSRYRAALLDPTGLPAEAYRMLRTALLARHGGQFKTLAVTSPSAQEGKSTAASNLAIVLAQRGRNVLLIDADMHNPVQHVAHHVTAEYGLSTVLNGKADWHDAVVTGGEGAPDLLPAGPTAANPTELLNSESFETLLADLSKQYDYVIIDTAPVSCVADSRVVCAYCDLSILVIRAERTNLKACQHAFQALEMVGCNIAGVLINDVAASYSRTYGAIEPYYNYQMTRAPARRLLPPPPYAPESVNSAADDELAPAVVDPRPDPLARQMSAPYKLNLLGVGVSPTNYDEVVRVGLNWARAGREGLVAFMPVHGLIEAVRDQNFRLAMQSFDIVAPDGQPVRWGLNRLHKAELSDRVYGPTCMLRLCRAAEQHGVGIYLYGSTPEVLDALVRRLNREFPRLIISGYESPPFRQLSETEDRQAVDRINSSGAGMLFIGLGCPKQELFAFHHRNEIRPVQFCVGAAFDFHAGFKPMAPQWMQRSGLEWLFRLVQEPRRLARRYLVTNSLYVCLIARELVKRAFQRAAGPRYVATAPSFHSDAATEIVDD